MASQNEVMQAELRDQRMQIFRKSVGVIPGPGLAGIAEPAAIVGDDSITGR